LDGLLRRCDALGNSLACGRVPEQQVVRRAAKAGQRLTVRGVNRLPERLGGLEEGDFAARGHVPTAGTAVTSSGEPSPVGRERQTIDEGLQRTQLLTSSGRYLPHLERATAHLAGRQRCPDG